jgi:hypothetical protein
VSSPARNNEELGELFLLDSSIAVVIENDTNEDEN